MDEMTKESPRVACEVEEVGISEIHPHPRNYRTHPDDQIEHLIESIREHGLYRNVVVARDGTILAGHGVVEAAKRMGFEKIPVVRLDIAPDDPRALKVLTGDNEIEHLAMQDDRMLTNILKEISETDISGLLGTGYDEHMLANLAFITRPMSEIADFDEAAHWVGMPEFDVTPKPWTIVISFETNEQRKRFARELGIKVTDSKTASTWWPPREREDPASLQFKG